MAGLAGFRIVFAFDDDFNFDLDYLVLFFAWS